MDERALLLTALSNLRTDEERWRAQRLATVQRARHLVTLGVRVSDICAVLDISQATWFRRCRELDARLSAEGQAQAVAGRDQVDAHISDVEVDR